MKLVGLDSSTFCTALSFWEDGKYLEYSILDLHKSKNYKTKWDRIDPMISHILNKLNEFQPDIVYQEDSWAGKDMDTLKALTNILGAVRGWCLVNNKTYYKVMPTSWRATLKLNKSKAKREELKQITKDYIESKYGFECPTDDVSDAIAIGEHGIIKEGYII